MRIGPPEYDCSLGIMQPSQLAFMFNIPGPSENSYDTSIINEASYIDTKPAGCSSSFTLLGSNGQSLPSYYNYDSSTGQLTFTSIPSYIINDELELVVYSTDSVTNRILDYPYIHE